MSIKNIMSRAETTVILFFNKPSLTARCLTSVWEDVHDREDSADARIILVDNGSAVESAAKIRAFVAANALKWKNFKIEFVRIEENAGFARGMNAGLKAAFAECDTNLVAMLSNDVEVPQGFRASVRKLDALTPVIWCPEVYYLSDRAKPSYTHGRLDLESWELSHHFDPAHGEITFPDYYPAAAMVWSREAFTRTGGFNERYFCYWEDVELAYRCRKAGVRLMAAHPLRVHHLGRGTTGGKSGYSEEFTKSRQLTQGIIIN